MKITKLGHSCLLVEMPKRTALFDPGVYSEVDVDSLEFLDDIIITHKHPDHMDVELIKKLQAKFKDVRLKASSEVTGILNDEGLEPMQECDEGVAVFDAPHEKVEPLAETPDNMGVHYLKKLTHPGDCIHFDTTMPILALPMTAPWGATVDSVNLALKLKPQYVIPIHDWHWNGQAREAMYQNLADIFDKQGIGFLQPENGVAFNVDE